MGEHWVTGYYASDTTVARIMMEKTTLQPNPCILTYYSLGPKPTYLSITYLTDSSITRELTYPPGKAPRTHVFFSKASEQAESHDEKKYRRPRSAFVTNAGRPCETPTISSICSSFNDTHLQARIPARNALNMDQGKNRTTPVHTANESNFFLDFMPPGLFKFFWWAGKPFSFFSKQRSIERQHGAEDPTNRPPVPFFRAVTPSDSTDRHSTPQSSPPIPMSPSESSSSPLSESPPTHFVLGKWSCETPHGTIQRSTSKI